MRPCRPYWQSWHPLVPVARQNIWRLFVPVDGLVVFSLSSNGIELSLLFFGALSSVVLSCIKHNCGVQNNWSKMETPPFVSKRLSGRSECEKSLTAWFKTSFCSKVPDEFQPLFIYSLLNKAEKTEATSMIIHHLRWCYMTTAADALMATQAWRGRHIGER